MKASHKKMYEKIKAAANDLGGNGVYVHSAMLDSAFGYEQVSLYSLFVYGEDFKAAFTLHGRRTQLIFSTAATEREVDRSSHDKYGGLIYITLPMTAEAIKVINRLWK